MAEFAPVAPVHILQQLLERRLFGDYHLFLAHHTVEKRKEFQQLMRGVYHQKNKSPYSKPLVIIMDNSIVELGGAVDDGMIADATTVIMNSGESNTLVIPCLPDVMGSASGTMVLSGSAYERWIEADMHKISGRGFMLVTQGETYEDFVGLVNYFLLEHREKYNAITWVGIPRYILKQWSEPSRRRAVAYIRMIRPDIHIHLLGFSQDIVDDLMCARMEGVTGIDSAVPVRYDGALVPTTSEAEIGSRGDWFEKGSLSLQNLQNIKNVRCWAKRSNVNAR